MLACIQLGGFQQGFMIKKTFFQFSSRTMSSPRKDGSDDTKIHVLTGITDDQVYIH